MIEILNPLATLSSQITTHSVIDRDRRQSQTKSGSITEYDLRHEKSLVTTLQPIVYT